MYEDELLPEAINYIEMNIKNPFSLQYDSLFHYYRLNCSSPKNSKHITTISVCLNETHNKQCLI
jgi:hypothetical protein